jgi:hypothetical protein
LVCKEPDDLCVVRDVTCDGVIEIYEVRITVIEGGLVVVGSSTFLAAVFEVDCVQADGELCVGKGAGCV